MPPGRTFRAVLFDVGGVLVDSPVPVLRRWESKLNLQNRFFDRVIVMGTSWSKWEKNEISYQEFCKQFQEECNRAGGKDIDVPLLIAEIEQMVSVVRPIMVEVLHSLRVHNYKIGVITNNWYSHTEGDPLKPLRDIVDVIIESRVVGINKPDPRIFQLACEQLRVQPDQCVFLDDIGRNLKAAKQLGMATIKVEEPQEAVKKLEALLGCQLTPDTTGLPASKL